MRHAFDVNVRSFIGHPRGDVDTPAAQVTCMGSLPACFFLAELGESSWQLNISLLSEA